MEAIKLMSAVVHAAKKWRHAYDDAKFPREKEEAEDELRKAVDELERSEGPAPR